MFKMPLKDEERRRAYNLEYKRIHRDELLRKKKIYYQENREEILHKQALREANNTLKNSRFEIEVYDIVETDKMIWQGVAPTIQEMLLLWNVDYPKSQFLTWEKIRDRIRSKKPPIDHTIKAYIDGEWTDEKWEEDD